MCKKLGILLARENTLIERYKDSDRSDEFFDEFFELTVEMIGAPQRPITLTTAS